ncbi:phytoene/squalene synthase family protein [Thermus thermamylovorans]|uniref:Phytoene/squalene synthase family protein n=1 Tax=Thermus thermamylovorans TaxID=2509362 RepID=A0A4Q9B749_9DEIN|nr:phytoene/squalene synthase family protein [Thermus thermamylovorans]TBH21554.1 phytoene/squalene synthase family protein [Thermus thermamylovorans]
MEPDWKALAGLIRHHSATFFLGSLLFPREERKGAWAVYAACRLGDEAVDGPGGGAEALEAWWRGVERAYGGRPREEWEKGLAWALGRWPIPMEVFLHMREGFLTDLSPVRLRTEEELMAYCYQVAGTVGRMMAPIAGGGKEVEEKAVRLGQAMQLTNILRDVGEDLERDRVYLPQDLLERFGVSLADLHQGRVTPQYRALMAHLEAKARALYREGLSGLGGLRVGRAAIALAALQYQGILDKLRLFGYDNLHRRAYLGTWERLRLLPKALLLSRNGVPATEA